MKKNIAWKPGERPGKSKLPPLYSEQVVPSPPLQEMIERYLYIGALWETRIALSKTPWVASRLQHEFQYIRPADTLGVGGFCRRGAAAIYMGTTRVTEVTMSGHEMRPIRPIFLVGDSMVMTNNVLLYFSPAGKRQ